MSEQTPETPARREQALRARARTAEAERDTYRDQLAALRRGEVLRLAGEHLRQPADLLDLGGVEVDAVLAEDGAVDAEKVASAAAALVADRGEHFARARPKTPDADGGARTSATPPTSWDKVLGGGRR